MTRQIVRTAALGTAVLLAGAASVAFGAEPYPNPHRIVRYLDAETDTTVNGVVNNGTIYKRGAGTATFVAPALNGGGSLVVSEGDVSLDLDAAPTVPTLPSYLIAKAKLWSIAILKERMMRAVPSTTTMFQERSFTKAAMEMTCTRLRTMAFT